jgi:hypothetical protein
MKLRSTIFDSKSEQKVFRSLESRWLPRVSLYPSLPLSKIIEIEPDELSSKESQFFYKTNVDYTFCEADGNPILSIEFDGIGGGFSRDGVYIPVRETEDPYRKLKMDFKLKTAREVKYPLVVISYDEIKSLDEEESLTILDAIVGNALARKEYLKLLDELYERDKNEIDSMDKYQRDEYLQDLVLTAEVQAQLDHDPVAKKAAQYQHYCTELAKVSWEEKFLQEPPLPTVKDMFDHKGVLSRIKAFKDIERIGHRVIIKTPEIPVVCTTWIRNFQSPNINPMVIVKNIARYLAFKRAFNLLKTKQNR